VGVGTDQPERQNAKTSEKRMLMSELQTLRDDVSDRLDLLENRLLREFQSWGSISRVAFVSTKFWPVALTSG